MNPPVEVADSTSTSTKVVKVVKRMPFEAPPR
jgi:hypothetical protein